MKKTIRIFISSTYNDLKTQRAILQKFIFPKLKEYAEHKDITILPIDLKWEEDINPYMLKKVISEEKHLLTQPNSIFLMLIGNEYGNIPIPNFIEKDLFENIISNIQNEKDKEYIKALYKLDYNHIPISYIIDSNNNIDTSRIINIFQNSAKNLKDKKEEFFKSFLEIEFDEFVEHSSSKKLIFSIIKKNRDKNEKLENLIEKVKQNTPLANIREIEFEDIDISKIESIENLPFNYRNFTDFITDYITSYIDKIAEEEIKEQEYHIDYKFNLLKQSIIGREKELKKALTYIKEENLIVISGKSGVGKSVFIANLIELLKYKNLIYRFTGITTESSDLFLLLESIVKEAGFELKTKIDISQTSSVEKLSIIKKFFLEVKEKLELIKEDTIIIIDAIEQTNQAEIDNLSWIPSNKKVKIVISAINDPEYEKDSLYYQKFIVNSFKDIKLEPFTKHEYKDALLEIIKRENRTLTNTQIEYVLTILENVSTMIYIKNAAEIVKEWRSYTKNLSLPNNNKEIIKERFKKLYNKYNFNKELINTIFAYIIISKESLTENLIIEVFNKNKNLLSQLKDRIYFENLDIFPLGLWGRIKIYLEEVINANNKNVIKFSHREYRKAANDYLDIDKSIELLKLLESLSINEMLLFTHIQVLATIKQLAPFFIINKNFFKKLNKYQLEYYFSMLIKLTFKTNKQIREYCIICYEITEFIYPTDPHKWLGYYIKSLNSMASLYIEKSDYAKAFEFLQRAYNELKKIDEYNMERFLIDYANTIQKISNNFIKLGEIKYINELILNIIEILRVLYTEKPEKWIRFYIDFIQKIEKLNYKSGLIEEAKKLYKEDLKIIKSTYEKNPEKWIIEYSKAIINIANLEYITGNLDELEDLWDSIRIEIRNKIKKNKKVIKDYVNIIFKANLLRYNLNQLDIIEENIKEIENLIEENKKEIDYEQLHASIIEHKIELYSKFNYPEAEQYIYLLLSYIDENLSKNIRYKIKILQKSAKILFNNNQIEKAEKLLLKSIEESENLYKNNSLRYFHSYLKSIEKLEKFYFKTNNLKKAKELYEKNIDILQKAYNESNEKWIKDYLISLINLGRLYGITAQKDRCLYLFNESLNILEKQFSENKEKWSRLYFEINSIITKYLLKNGQIEEAKKIIKKTILEIEKLYNKNHFKWMPLYSESLLELGNINFEIGQIEKAKKLYEKVLNIKTITYNIKPEEWIESYSITLVNMADLYYKTDRFEEAEKLYKENIELLKDAYEDNPKRWLKLYTTNINNLANLYIVNEKREQAEKSYKEILEVLNDAYEKYNEEVVEDYTHALHEVSKFYESKGKIQVAEPLALEAIEVLKKAYKENPQKWTEPYLKYLESLAELYDAIEAYENSKTIHQHTLNILKEAYETNPEKWLNKYVTNLNNTAYLNELNNNLEEAEKLYKDTIQLIEPNYQKDNSKYAPLYISALTNLAHLYESNSQFKEAKQLYLYSLSIIKKEFTIDPEKYLEDYIAILQKLAEIEEALGNIKESIKYLDELTKTSKNFITKPLCKTMYESASKKIAFLTNNINSRKIKKQNKKRKK